MENKCLKHGGCDHVTPETYPNFNAGCKHMEGGWLGWVEARYT